MWRRAYGWLLFITSWVLHIAGGLLAGVGASPSFPFAILGRLVAIGAGLLILSAGFKVRANGRRRLVRVITSVDGLPPGSYVLYLRPFGQDQVAAGVDSMGHLTAQEAILRSGLTHEERLAKMFQWFGPMITVGRPGEKLPSGSGANRFYVPLDNWQGTVSSLMDRASVILLGAGPGPGTVWEYQEIIRRGQHHRLVILAVDPSWYEDFKALTAAALTQGLPGLRRLHGAQWRPPVLPDLPPPLKPRSKQAFYVRAMIYFGPGWEPSLTAFDRSAVDSMGPGNYLKRKAETVLGHLRLAQSIDPPHRAPNSPGEPAEMPADPGPATPEREPPTVLQTTFPSPPGQPTVFTNIPPPWAPVLVRVIWVAVVVGSGVGWVATVATSSVVLVLLVFVVFVVVALFATACALSTVRRWKELVIDSLGFAVSMVTLGRNRYILAAVPWDRVIQIYSPGRPGRPPALCARTRGDGYNPERIILLCRGGLPEFPIQDILVAIRKYYPPAKIDSPPGIQI
jgi:hypothetical protein